MIETVYINLGILALNLIVLALTLKLYTEILKDKAQDSRAKKRAGEDAVERAARRHQEGEQKRREEEKKSDGG